MLKISLPKWLLILLVIVLLLRIPSLFEPFYYGDEMIYLTLGQGIRTGVTLYSQLHDNKPPLLYLLAGISGNVFWFRTILAFWNFATIVIFWKLVKKLFTKNELLQKVAVVAFALLTTLPTLEGNIANAELFMIGPTMLAYLILLNKPGVKRLLFAGFLFASATLFKVPSAFDVFPVIFFWIITGGFNLKNIKTTLYNTLMIGMGYTITIGLTFIWYYTAGALREYTIAAFLQNVGYLSSWRPNEVELPFYVKNAPLLIRGGIVLVSIVILFWQRKVLSREFVLLTCLVLFSLFGATLSERPYPHYIIQVVPAISLFIGLLVAGRNSEQSYSVIPLGLVVFTLFYFNFWRYPVVPYYKNFIQFTIGSISKNEYFNSFNNNTVRNYEISKLVNSVTAPDERVFVWGSDATIYALSRRLPPIKYVADYHINDFSSQQAVYEGLNTNLPEIIVIVPGSGDFPELERLVRLKYLLLANIDNGLIYKKLNSQIEPLEIR